MLYIAMIFENFFVGKLRVFAVFQILCVCGIMALSGCGTAQGDAEQGWVAPEIYSPELVTTYTFTFHNFTTREVLSIAEVMEREFSGFVRARSPEGNSSAFKYGYVTKASGNELYRWVNLLLMNMGLDPDRQVKFTERGTKIEIDKLFDGPSRQSQTKNCRYC